MIAIGGALLAVAGAIAASPLLPFGVARRADPDPGLHADWQVLSLGALAVVAVVLVISVVAALRSTRSRSAPIAVSGRRSGLASSARSRARGLSPAATTGLRMATEPGSGNSRGAASVGRVRCRVRRVRAERAHGVRCESRPSVVDATPLRLDVRLQVGDDQRPALRRHRPGHLPTSGRRRRWRSRATRTCSSRADRSSVGDSSRSKGTLGPAIVAGRAPQTPHEVALGAATMHALAKRDRRHRADRRDRRGQPVIERIVGEAVFPQLGDAQPVADGAWFTSAGWYAAGATDDQFSRFLVGTYAPHAGPRRDHTPDRGRRTERTRWAVRSCQPRSTDCARSTGSRRQPPLFSRCWR